MNEEYPQGIPPEQIPLLQPLPRLTAVERLGLSPLVFALLALFLVLVLYQTGGLVMTLILFGFNPLAAKASDLRIAQGVGEVLFILVPTLILVRLITFHPAKYFRLKLPDIRLLGLALVGIFSLQQVLQIFMVFQDKIPIPEWIDKFLEPFKQMFDIILKMLVGANSIPELLLVVVVVALIPAIAEEFFFRGLVQKSFERSLGSTRGVLLTGVIFGGFHLNPSEFIPLAMLGIYLGFLAMRSECLWTSVLAHFFNNTVACVAFYMNIDEDAVVTGNPSNMPLAELLFTVVVCSIIFAISTYYFLKLTQKNPPESIAFPGDQTGSIG
jgi:uncharacterized protein